MPDCERAGERSRFLGSRLPKRGRHSFSRYREHGGPSQGCQGGPLPRTFEPTQHQKQASSPGGVVVQQITSPRTLRDLWSFTIRYHSIPHLN
jgi:hypothetical protein